MDNIMTKDFCKMEVEELQDTNGGGGIVLESYSWLNTLIDLLFKR